MTESYAWADHRVFPTDAGALLYGVDHGSLFAVDGETRSVLDRWRDREPVVLSEAPVVDREVLEGLREAWILRPAGRGRPARHPRPDPGGIPLSTLVLEVAQSCNLSCSYCYADGGAYGGEPGLIDPDLAREAARHLVRASGDRDAVTLVLFGGEPLLNFAAIEAAIGEAEAEAARHGKRVAFSLTTNGTLLTREMAAYLADRRVAVSLSIDGPPGVQDANRPYRDGRPTYERVFRAAGELLAAGVRPLAARVTLLPSQWGRVPEIFDHLSGLGFHEVGIAPASPVRTELLPSAEQEDDLIAGFRELSARFVREAREGRILPFSNLLDLLARLHEGQTRGIPCGAGLGYLAVDIRGRFYVCHRLAGEGAFHTGDLRSGPDPERTRECLDALAEPREEACSACWARTLCAGGCHYENHLREHTLGLAPGGSCSFVKRWLELGIRVYAELTDGAGEALWPLLKRRAAC